MFGILNTINFYIEQSNNLGILGCCIIYFSLVSRITVINYQSINKNNNNNKNKFLSEKYILSNFVIKYFCFHFKIVQNQ